MTMTRRSLEKVAQGLPGALVSRLSLGSLARPLSGWGLPVPVIPSPAPPSGETTCPASPGARVPVLTLAGHSHPLAPSPP